ncbi:MULTISPECIES: prohead protease/major capsid protein fusion protein [unclassified Agrobacterium]|uniref:prohead protease/major capsid protein fusion protein n=1 Tax=unclassified Agrobacterium TaxID=2632611 RepID=UPI002449B109|nr:MULTISPECIES: prohead protease/major capsid protein fusion protein [unclassified Agrobacterium]MDH0613431.1 Mu-like prophage major head subunit gpT family protein [Agrobacterium sp. GD03872]MDH0697348.1 Mu-like prophage major head subunit gpT family protein [Agrobacterium sp. GD03871]MDH1060871.1 Mu-like prophage major head subunit gpT family protein [Agrobacterium sp. GD03992]MDH2211455.1 Mu-like prophage major head subunit gpT family protein [Agrobacterium sp. GD03643]MDH2220714.1 Mu-like
MPEMIENVQTREDRKVSSFNDKARTVDIVLATENEVKRRSWEEGPYVEILSVNRAAIDTTRLNALPLVDQHDVYNGMSARLGSVVPGSLRFENGTAIVTAKISRNEKGAELFRDLEDGHVFGASVGYRIDEFKKTDAPSGGLPTIRATRWTPLELSIVSIPADPAATTRSLETERNPQMPQATQTQTNDDDDDHATRQMSVREARGFATEFMRATNTSEFGDEVQDRIKRGMTQQQVRDILLEVIVARQESSPTFPHVETRGVHENRYDGLTRNQAMADALMLRLNPDHKLKGSSRDFVGLSLVEIARRTLEANGISTIGQGAGETITRALHTTSDFGIVISDVGKTVLLASYAATPSALKAVGKRAIVKDFKTKNAVRLTKTGGLQKVNEHGEFKRGSFTESKESYRVDTFGEIIGMSRQMLINDDLGAFSDRALLLAQQATRFEAKFLVSLLKSNPIMGDGKDLFHSTHGNLAATATVLNHATLAAGRKSFRKQTDDAGEPIGLGPKFLVVGPEQETIAEQVLAQIQPAHTGDVNVFAGKLQLIVEDRLGDSPEWYLVADPNLVPGLEYAYLEGFEGPYFEDNWGFNVDGVETKVRLDFGGGFMDWRGWYKNPGLAG